MPGIHEKMYVNVLQTLIKGDTGALSLPSYLVDISRSAFGRQLL